jgi:ribosome biogenesis GTPase A
MADTSRINWFPGHMNTARKEIRKVMGKVDLVIEVLDARIPFSSENPLVAELRRDRPCVQILNKSDLAEPAVTAEWLNAINAKPGVRALATHQHQAKFAQRLLRVVRELVPPKMSRPTVAMILGIPNVGKSTLVNTLSGRSIAKTGNKPAVTQRQQRIRLGKELVLLDTPGFLWPKLTPRACGYRLALTGAISDRVIDAEEIAHFGARFLVERHPGVLISHYKLDELPQEPQALLDAIGRRRGFMRKGGVVDIERVAKTLIMDLRAGNLGPVTLETPADCF